MRGNRFLVALFVVVAAACADGGDNGAGGASSTTEAPATTSSADAPASSTTSVPPVDGASVVVDAVAVTGMTPTVVVDDGGLASVTYMREIEPNEFEIMASACVDPACGEMVHSMAASGFVRVLAGGAQSTDAGVLVAGTPIGPSSVAFSMCSTTGCAESDRFTGDLLGLSANEDQPPVVGYGLWSEEAIAYEVYIGFCEDTRCSSHRPVLAHDGDDGVGTGDLQMLPDGSPVLFYPSWDSTTDIERWHVAVCDGPSCSGVTVHVQDPTWESVPPPPPTGLPSIVYSVEEEVRLLACVDDGCTALSDRPIHTVSGVESVVEATGTYLGDTLYVLVRYATELPPSPLVEWELQLLACRDTTCRSVDDVPFTRGNFISLTAVDEATLVVAVQSGRQFLCAEGVGCADPTDDLSALTLHFIAAPQD